MADDIFLSPEEQDERARQWFKDNGPALGIGIALGLAAVVGYNKYQDDKQLSAEKASELFQQTVAEIRDSELSSIEEQVNTLKSEHASTVYAAKATLLKAKQTAVNDLAGAFDELQWVVDNAPEDGIKHTARIRQAKIKLALNQLDAARSLASFTPTQGFESHYQEVLGDIAIKEGKELVARTHYQAAVDALDGLQDTYVQVLNIKLDRLPLASEATETAPQAAAAIDAPAEPSVENEPSTVNEESVAQIKTLAEEAVNGAEVDAEAVESAAEELTEK